MKLSSFALCLTGFGIGAGAVNAAITDTLIFQDFGSHPKQSSLSAAKGQADSGKPWIAGGWWYQFKDATGAQLTDGLDQKLDSFDQVWSDSLMHVKFVGAADTGANPYMGIGVGLIGDGSKAYNLTGLSSVIVKARGTGSIRLKMETANPLDWGTFGYTLDLDTAWKTFVIPVEEFTGSQYSMIANDDLTSRIDSVMKLSFQVSGTGTVDFYLKEIAFVGLRTKSFGFTTDSLVFQDFGSHPKQTSLAAAKGQADSGKPWIAGGWWYTFKDATGAQITDGLDQKLDSFDQVWSDSLMHIKFVGHADTGANPYLGIGVGILGDGTKAYNLTGITSVAFTVRGTGSIRFKWETEDLVDWGTYGYTLALDTAWKTIIVPVEEFTGSMYSLIANQDLTSGIAAVKQVGFQSSDTSTVDLYLKSIVFRGILLQDVVPAAPPVGVVAKSGMIRSNSAWMNAGKLNLKLGGAANVEIFNLSGRSVQSMGSFGAGSHSVGLKGLQSGTYFVRIVGTGLTQSIPVHVFAR